MHETDGNTGWYQWSNSTFYSFDKIQTVKFALLAHFFKIYFKRRLLYWNDDLITWWKFNELIIF